MIFIMLVRGSYISVLICGKLYDFDFAAWMSINTISCYHPFFGMKLTTTCCNFIYDLFSMTFCFCINIC